ncbi:chaperonin 10-like protein [Aspergillus alliaceus]|uniref:chaperonin 10-like protein n=1 Tax=Petromyces alliaceus TaxID=209559 RepID=UPI0012A4C5DC|nr:chaperonin 10-like protein [Aspergillus alliaceus]KAB8235507.1 chaperonin 10-like protein [Aspergillus alliaceus]
MSTTSELREKIIGSWTLDKCVSVVFQGFIRFSIEDRPKPSIVKPSDAVVKITHTTICGTDLHILQNDIPVSLGHLLSHEGVRSHLLYWPGCYRPSHRVSGGWILGNEIDGTQAEHVRITHTSFSLHPLSDGAEPKATVMLSDVFRTAYEAGMLNGQVKPGSEVVIIGSGPIGLVALITLKKLFGPSQVVVIGREQSRLDVAKGVGVEHTLSLAFETAQALVAPGGTIASLGAYGCKCDLNLEYLLGRNIAVKSRVVDTIGTRDILTLSLDSSFDEVKKAYVGFGAVSKHDVLKVVITM